MKTTRQTRRQTASYSAKAASAPIGAKKSDPPVASKSVTDQVIAVEPSPPIDEHTSPEAFPTSPMTIDDLYAMVVGCVSGKPRC